MSCPSSGGAQRLEIAPGYFECTSQVATVTTDMVPDLAMQGRYQPVPGRGSRICGARYQTGQPGSAALVCSCGTFAIGWCAECATAVCGQHSALTGDRRLCTACRDSERSAAAAVDSDRKARRARLMATEPPRLLADFLRLAEQRGWPGAVNIHETRRLQGPRGGTEAHLPDTTGVRCLPRGVPQSRPG